MKQAKSSYRCNICGGKIIVTRYNENHGFCLEPISDYQCENGCNGEITEDYEDDE